MTTRSAAPLLLLLATLTLHSQSQKRHRQAASRARDERTDHRRETRGHEFGGSPLRRHCSSSEQDHYLQRIGLPDDL